MITGYNTDVKREGKVYHVQTEDKGERNPIIETLVYVGGGQIIASRQYSYAGLVADGKADEKIVSELLDSQHRQTLRWITGGKFDPGGPPPFGASIISERTFDEVVLDFIRQQSEAEPIEIVIADDFRPVAGTTGPMKVLIRNELSNAPAPGAQVLVTLNAPESAPVRLLAAAAGSDGTVEGKVKLPIDSAGGSIRIEARHAGQTGTLDVIVAKP